MSRNERLLLDTGAGVNLIKNGFCENKIKLRKPHIIRFGNDKHTLNYVTFFTVHGKRHKFFIITDDFPLIEDGIIGVFETT